MAKKSTKDTLANESESVSGEIIPSVTPFDKEPKEQPEVLLAENKIELKDSPVESENKAPEEPKKEEPKTFEEKIIGFLKGRSTGAFVPINDFMKSLYGIPKLNEPKLWHDQRTMKGLKNTLDGMVKNGQILIEGNRHQQLAKFYYPDNNPVTHYYNLDTLPLKAKLA